MAWAAIQAIAAIIGAAASAKAATTTSTSRTEQPGQPVGQVTSQPSVFNQGQDDLMSILGDLTQVPSLNEIIQNAQASAAATNQAASTPPAQPNVPTPDGDGGGGGGDGDTGEADITGAEIGEILAAIPAALAATGDLLGVSDVNEITQRPAPVAGGQGGGLVGQFARPFGQNPNIGQLLAALPGIR